MARPRISIVIPSLNQGEYLDQAIQSVLDQSEQGSELIVMDGGSTDGSVAAIRKHAARIAHWVSAPDAGPAAALNAGFSVATGDILGFLNADDFYLPGAFTQVADAFAQSPGIDVCAGHGYFASASGELGAPMVSDRWNLTHFKYGACVLLQPATFFRRAAFDRAGGFPETGRVCWDMELWARLARSGARFHTLDAFLAGFRLHEKSITGAAELQKRRRLDARAVMAEMRGRPEGLLDRAGHAFFRAAKFGRHPITSLKRRTFVFRALKRWSL
jgi:cellulose synthase/poly-beta-1,6-N-acetylglucosamine synthase-like glycosyltransferase